jgi:hypothetical protein
MPGNNWDKNTNQYTVPAPKNHVSKEVTLDASLSGKYIISIAVLDPAGMLPSLRFATENYFKGGRHPMGYVGVNEDITAYEIDYLKFFDMRADNTLKYRLD